MILPCANGCGLAERRRFGYRRLLILRREGSREPQAAFAHLSGGTSDGTQAGRSQKSSGRTGADGSAAAARDRWSLDFVSDQLASGRRFRILAIFDDCTRECLAAVADLSLSGLRVARELDLLIARRGRPRTILSDNGTELTSNAILGWSSKPGWDGTTSHPASPCRTPSSRASMGV